MGRSHAPCRTSPPAARRRSPGNARARSHGRGSHRRDSTRTPPRRTAGVRRPGRCGRAPLRGRCAGERGRWRARACSPVRAGATCRRAAAGLRRRIAHRTLPAQGRLPLALGHAAGPIHETSQELKTGSSEGLDAFGVPRLGYRGYRNGPEAVSNRDSVAGRATAGLMVRNRLQPSSGSMGTAMPICAASGFQDSCPCSQAIEVCGVAQRAIAAVALSFP